MGAAKPTVKSTIKAERARKPAYWRGPYPDDWCECRMGTLRILMGAAPGEAGRFFAETVFVMGEAKAAINVYVVAHERKAALQGLVDAVRTIKRGYGDGR